MNLVEKLLRVDAGKADEKKEKKIISKRLGELMGANEGVEITIREISAKRMNDIVSKMYNNKGNFDMSKSFDAKAIACAEAVVEPDLKNKDLQEHFKCGTPKDLAIKLFGNEITHISDEIAALSGYSDVEDTDEEIKN